MTNTLRTADVEGKTILLRIDVNVPMQAGVISDDTRIRRAMPTIEDLQKRGAKTILLSHFGRPNGKADASLSLKPIADAMKVKFCDVVIGQRAESAINALKNGEVLMLENIRFYAEEEQGDDAFAKTLSSYADIYVNDAFSCSHRAHASISGIARYLPSYFGYNMEEEVSVLTEVFSAPQRPVAALVGGSKVSTKMDLLENLVEKVDILMIGGGMANTFLYAQGHDVGASLCEKDLKDTAISVLNKAKQSGCEILLPVDVVLSKTFSPMPDTKVACVDAIDADMMALDLGAETMLHWANAIKRAKTLIWNGPVGAFEMIPFDNSTLFLARIIAAQTQSGGLVSVAGGGDTVSALARAGLSDAVTYLSTAGGAFLEWLEGKALPGVAAITNTHNAHKKAS
jgi:phosphoglycerate kinase